MRGYAWEDMSGIKMKEKITGLHTSARRYCIEKISCLDDKILPWSDKYIEVYKKTGNMNNEEIKRIEEIYPKIDVIRRSVLDIILNEIEKTVPENYKTLEQARKDIVFTGENGEKFRGKNIIYTEPTYTNNEKQIMKEERQAFCNYINSLKEEDLEEVEPLFYRRVLSYDKSRITKTVLKKKYDCCNLVHFEDEVFKNSVSIDMLRDVLEKHGIDRVFELNDDGAWMSYEMDVTAFKLYPCKSLECYWCSKEMEWMIYHDHEGYIHIAGEWLIEEIKSIWNDWENYYVM